MKVSRKLHSITAKEDDAQDNQRMLSASVCYNGTMKVGVITFLQQQGGHAAF